MLALRLVRLIETHSEQLAASLHETLMRSPECSDLRKLQPTDLVSRASEIYQNLNDWLVEKPESDVARHFEEIGFRRAGQGVAFSHIVWAILATKWNLRRFLEGEGVSETPVEVYGALELFALFDRFFDSAIYHAAEGYERYQATIGHSGEERVA
jgi:hypothetical protein